jgi:L-alanine-DL-glutamate epimerase-like enolase superfamily enzyme
MLRTLDARHDAFPLATPFRISRGVRTVCDVVAVTIAADGHVGRGEGSPSWRYGESVADAIAAIEAIRPAIEGGADRDAIGRLLPPGAARNAIDCALWDIESRLTGTPVATTLGLPAIGDTPTAMTIGLDDPAAMGQAAHALRDVPWLKVKVDRSDPVAQIRAVRDAAPAPRMIVDANESWTFAQVADLQGFLQDMRADLLEQPLPAGEDHELDGFVPRIPIAADESAHVAADIDALAARYQVINIKLDKTGGLTAALALAQAARARQLGVMLGCMICTSLSIAPALMVAATADFIDLDGPLWLTEDRAGGVRGRDGVLSAPAPGFWGA